MRVAFLSDLHAGGFLDGGDVDRICARLAACEPDLVCLGGDLIEGADSAELALLDAGLARLRPPLGIFAVPGNHEYFADLGPDALAAAFSKHGVISLVNAGHRIECNGSSLWLAGVDDLSRGAPDLPAALAGAREEEPILLLSHHPDLFVEAAWAGVDMTLSGHTHAGQIVVAGWTAFKRSHYGYQGGWFEREGARLYVGRGAGVTGMPVRLGAPPEVPIFRLAPPSV